MNDIIVTIRIPDLLLSKIKNLVEKGYYMDSSEAIRCIVRDKWMSYTHPELSELKNIREDIKKGLQKRGQKIAMKEVIAELKKIKDMVKDGDFK